MHEKNKQEQQQGGISSGTHLWFLLDLTTTAISPNGLRSSLQVVNCEMSIAGLQSHLVCVCACARQAQANNRSASNCPIPFPEGPLIRSAG